MIRPVLFADPDSYMPNNAGWSMAAGDFNGDGHPDLAVGAPANISGSTKQGRVLIYEGTSADLLRTEIDPVTVMTHAKVVLDGELLWASPSTPEHDQFGYSVAAGRIFGDHLDRDGLIVGVPGHVDDSHPTRGAIGGLCQFRFDDTFTVIGERCIENTLPGDLTDARLGEKVAIGDFAPYDAGGSEVAVTGDTDSEEVIAGDAMEVAASAPGFSSERGEVALFASGPDGINENATLVNPLDEDAAAAPGNRFGAALASGYVQRSHRPEDLVIGSPGANPVTVSGFTRTYGRVTDTIAPLASGACDEIYGDWTIEDPVDHDEHLVRISPTVGGTVLVTFEDAFPLEVRDLMGDLCTVDDDGTNRDLALSLIPGSYFETDTPWDCEGSSTQGWSVSADAVMAAIGDARGDAEILSHPGDPSRWVTDPSPPPRPDPSEGDR